MRAHEVPLVSQYRGTDSMTQLHSHGYARRGRVEVTVRRTVGPHVAADRTAQAAGMAHSADLQFERTPVSKRALTNGPHECSARQQRTLGLRRPRRSTPFAFW